MTFFNYRFLLSNQGKLIWKCNARYITTIITLRAYLGWHQNLWNKISFYRNIFLSIYLFIDISFYRNIFLSQYLFVAISFYQNIFLSKYLFIAILCVCDMGLNQNLYLKLLISSQSQSQSQQVPKNGGFGPLKSR